MNWYVCMRIVEIRTKIISMSTFVLGTLLAVYHSESFDPVLFGLMLAATLLVDMGTTAFNTYFDFHRGVDAREHNREKDKVLVHDGVAPGWALAIAIVVFAGAVVLGFIIAWMTSWWVAVIGAVCMAVGYVYTGGPLPISATPVGELFAGGFLGSVLFVIAYYVQAGAWALPAVLASLPSTFLIAAILAVNNACDVQGDAASGRRTLAVLLQPRHSALPVPVLFTIGILIGPAAYLYAAIPWQAAVGIVAAGMLAVPRIRSMYLRGFSHATKGPNMGSISQVVLLYTAGYAAGLAAALIGL